MLDEIESRRDKEINHDFYQTHVKDYDGLQEKLEELTGSRLGLIYKEKRVLLEHVGADLKAKFFDAAGF